MKQDAKLLALILINCIENTQTMISAPLQGCFKKRNDHIFGKFENKETCKMWQSTCVISCRIFLQPSLAKQLLSTASLLRYKSTKSDVRKRKII